MKKEMPKQTKEEIIKAARTVFSHDNTFWVEVERLMNKRAKKRREAEEKVQPRPVQRHD